MKVIYPGSFDPFTKGHLDIVERASKLFDEVHVVVAHNEDKDHLFDASTRYDIVEESTRGLDNVIPVVHSGVTSDYINREWIDVLVRGIRNGDDLRYEEELEQYFRKTTNAETIYLTPSIEHSKTSSTVVRRFLVTGKMEEASEYLANGVMEVIKEEL